MDRFDHIAFKYVAAFAVLLASLLFSSAALQAQC